MFPAGSSNSSRAASAPRPNVQLPVLHSEPLQLGPGFGQAIDGQRHMRTGRVPLRRRGERGCPFRADDVDLGAPNVHPRPRNGHVRPVRIRLHAQHVLIETLNLARLPRRHANGLVMEFPDLQRHVTLPPPESAERLCLTRQASDGGQRPNRQSRAGDLPGERQRRSDWSGWFRARSQGVCAARSICAVSAHALATQTSGSFPRVVQIPGTFPTWCTSLTNNDGSATVRKCRLSSVDRSASLPAVCPDGRSDPAGVAHAVALRCNCAVRLASKDGSEHGSA